MHISSISIILQWALEVLQHKGGFAAVSSQNVVWKIPQMCVSQNDLFDNKSKNKDESNRH